MRTANFASIRVVVPKFNYAINPETGKATTTRGVDLVAVGMAQNISISDSFGTRPTNVLGTPLPIITPGYMTTNISIEKCTIDGASFRSLGAFNPLWAHVGAVYDSGNSVTINTTDVPTDEDFYANGATNEESEMLPFMFILAIKDKISDSYQHGHLPRVGATAEEAKSNANAKAPNMFGTYACVLSDARIGLSSSQSIIMDSVTAIARPLSGSWLSGAVKTALQNQGAEATSKGKNGMDDYVNSTMYGYRSGKK